MVPSGVPVTGSRAEPEQAEPEEELELSTTSSESDWSGDDRSFGPGQTEEHAAKGRPASRKQRKKSKQAGSRSKQLRRLALQRPAGRGSSDGRPAPGESTVFINVVVANTLHTAQCLVYCLR
jgi:hypothetical protein